MAAPAGSHHVNGFLVDEDDQLYIANPGSGGGGTVSTQQVPASSTALFGPLNISVPGTITQLTVVPTPCLYVVVIASKTNADTVYISASNDISAASGLGIPLDPNQDVVYDINDVSKVLVDVLVANDGVVAEAFLA